MKKFLFVLTVLILILFVAGAVFLMTFNVDKYRPQIISQIENAIKKPVKLDRISLGWRMGVALELEGFAILNSRENPSEWVKLNSAKAVVNLTPLLARQIQVTTLYLDQPVLHLTKRSDGTIEGLEPSAPKEPREIPAGKPAVEKNTGGGAQAAAFSFLVDQIKIQDGEFFYREESLTKEPVEIALRDIDITLKNVGFNESIDFDAKAAVLSGRQNLKASGKLKISPQEGSNTLNRFHLETDLSQIDFDQLSQFNPSLAASGIQPPLEGTLTADIDSLKLDSAGLKNLAASIRFSNGTVRLRDLKAPVSNINADILGTTESIKIQNLSADAAGGKIQGQGAVNIRSLQNPVTAFNIKADRILLENLVQQANGPQPRGILSADFQGSAAGQNSPKILSTLDSTGRITIEQGVIENLNVLREIFQKLSSIPVFGNTLMQRLPASFQEKLEARDTHFETIELPVTAQNGILDFRKVNIDGDNFSLRGVGSYNLLQKTPSGQASLSIDADLTLALTRSVEELQYFTDQDGRLEIPLAVIQRSPWVTPDLQIIASRLAASKTREVLGNLLQKKQGTEGQTQQGTTQQGGLLGNFLPASSQNTAASDGTQTAPAKTKAPKASQILGQLLQGALQEQNQGNTGSTQQ